jgi:hypothetical protein
MSSIRLWRRFPRRFHICAPTARWRERLLEFKVFKVGLVWTGNPSHGNDRNRSLSLSMLALLITLPGVRVVSLQKGPAAEQSRLMPAPSDWTSEISDFADTAALIENLDLVISCDTAVAHLSGAMAKPTWVLLPLRPRLALASGPHRLALVSDGAAIPSA